MTEPDWRAIDRYLAGDASPDDERAIGAWIAADPSRGELLRQLRGARGDSTAESWDTDSAWQTFAARVKQPRRQAVPMTRLWYATPLARIAAVVLLVAGGYAAMSTLLSPRGPQPVATQSVETPNGQRATVTLGDGSRVVLNAGSRLRYPRSMARGPRDVHLEGEAYFEVTPKAGQPFRVHANGSVAHDLGTRFSVRAYPELTQVEVVVTEGKVSLRRDQATPTDSVILQAGQLGRLSAFDQAPTVSDVDVTTYTGWTGGTLVLENLTLGAAIPQLERWFDVEIGVADPALAARRIFVRFRDETVVQALDALSLALGVRYERTGRVITFHAGPSPSPASR